MTPEGQAPMALANPFAAADVEEVLREHGWLNGESAPEMQAWLNEAAALLGPHAATGADARIPTREALADLLKLIFVYDAKEVLANRENQAVMVREGAREVIRALANLVLDGGDIDSDRFRQVIEELKKTLGFRGRKLFHPLRLALAGRAGEGELDRVILLLDSAARVGFCRPVKGTRQRVIEFCAALG